MKLNCKATLNKLFLNINSKSFASKVFKSTKDALFDIKSGDSIMLGGFGICGMPENLLRVLNDKKDIKNLHLISSNGGLADVGIGPLIRDGQIRRITASYVGENKMLEKSYFDGKLELNLIPQGTLAEKIRCGGAGIPAFFTPTGYGTFVQIGGINIKMDEENPIHPPLYLSTPKQTKVFNGKHYVLEESINADYSFIKAYKADTMGNLIFRKTSRNFNKDMSMASKITIAEVEEIVEPGQLAPDEIHCPGIFVKRVVKGERFEHRLENIRKDKNGSDRSNDPKKLRIARRAAAELKSGMYVNLGIGIPNLVTEFLDPNCGVVVHTENGMLGVGPYPYGKEDSDLISALKEAVSETPGCSYFSSSDSFSMVRGHHINLSILGAFEVSEHGDLSNWIVPGKKVKGMGGAMDLVSSGEKVIVVMEHTTKEGNPKIFSHNTLPYTGKHVVNMLITDLAVFHFDEEGIILKEIFSNSSLEEIKSKTACHFRIADNIHINDY